MSDRSQEEEELSHTEVLADVEKQIEAVCNQLQSLQRQASRLRRRLRDEQEVYGSMSKKMGSMQLSTKVNLNVGGQHFTTTVQTLTKDPDSMLAAMFSGRFPMKPSEDGTFFIDRDGNYFRYILNYLRDGKLSLPEGVTFYEEIEAEAEFYQIQGILEELGKPRPWKGVDREVNATKPFVESKILTQEHAKILLGMVPYKTGRWRLLFRASRDGFAAESFHSKCDKKGPTLTVVRSGSFIFGGFTEAAWSSMRGDRGLQGAQSRLACDLQGAQSQLAFLFSLVNPFGLGPVRIPAEENQSGCFIVCESKYGPTFRYILQRDIFSVKSFLYISDKANASSSSYCSLFGNFSCPEGKPGDLFFTGSKNFTVDDYEVFVLY